MFIEADDRVSLFCNGWVADDENLTGQGPFHIRLGNSAIAGLVTGRMPCTLETPGKGSLSGRIDKSRNADCFIFERKAIRRES